MLPASRRILRGHLPDDFAVGRARHRLHVRFAPRPSAAGELAIFWIASKWNASPPVGEKAGFQAADLGGEIGAVIRLDANLFSLVLKLADLAAERTDLFDIGHGRATPAVAQDFYGQFLHQPHGPAAGLAHGARARRGIAHRCSRQRDDYV